VDAAAVDNRVGACKIYVFENAKRARHLVAVLGNALNAVLREDDDLAGLDLTDERCACRFKSAGLGGNNVAAVCGNAVAKRSEAVFVACGDQLAGGT